ncbi:N-ethylammeline chlorohydrolase [Oxalicibacterium flavum]|uniref:5-methylthioadenosine/S-adenosylhomocysteine deaminase n=1 Tax=Oxalicibacterium flavum TaxID=179467 RepID=A0A8J2XWR6_9BURK|nr:TRZ/ATZ family hydrolase [Oxalicibacterium flavum]GGB99050.1 N-ethylammeline chlorohydrolase [Oxalicibacterium flavum]
MTTVDLIVHARWIIPIVPACQVLEHASLVVDGGGIVAVLPQHEARQRYQARRTLQLDDHVLLPGLINAHGHAAMTLLRGFADDHPLETWLNEHIWPAEKQWVAADFVRDGTELAMAEMIRSGTTCFSDMYFFPEQIVQAAAGAGMRCQAAFPVMDFPTAWGDGPQTYLDKGLALAEQYRGDARIRVAFGPHAPYTVSPRWLERIVALAHERTMPIQIHLHETASEVRASLQEHGKRPMQRMMELGVLGPATQCVHMTQLDDGDIALLQQSGANVVHCPESNLKLASGFCPVGQLLQAGVNVALGTDGAASNNDLDLFGEMKAAALLAKAVAGDAAVLDAHAALRMATLNGARALGIDALVGSLEAGKRADFIAVSLADLAQQPVYRPASQLVYTAVGHCVTHVWVDGQCLLDQRSLQTIDEEAVRQRTRQWRQRVVAADR